MKAALITEEQIKAIEDALNDSEPFNFDLYRNALAIVKSLKVQEPVAEVVSDHHAGMYEVFSLGTLLYTAPPRKEWEGLTYGELDECQSDNPYRFYRAIEAKLKEKNT